MAAKKSAPITQPVVESESVVWTAEEMALVMASGKTYGDDLEKVQALGWSPAKYLSEVAARTPKMETVVESKEEDPAPVAETLKVASEPEPPDVTKLKGEILAQEDARRIVAAEHATLVYNLTQIPEGSLTLVGESLAPHYAKRDSLLAQLKEFDTELAALREKLSQATTAQYKVAWQEAEQSAKLAGASEKSDRDKAHRESLEATLKNLKAVGREYAAQVAKDRPGLVVFDSYVAPDGLLRPGKGAPETWQPKDQVGFHALLVEGWNLLREGPLTVESYVETVREGIRLLERGAPTTEQERQDVRGWVVVARNHLDRNSDDMYKPKVRHFLKRFSEFVHTAKKRAGVLPVTLETIPGGGKPSLPPSGPVKLVGAPDVEPGDTAKSETGWNPFA